MTDSFVTQCPHCQTSFRVSHAQLSVARGVVRCGACLQVFNAAKQLLGQRAGKLVEESQTPSPAPPTTPRALPPVIALDEKPTEQPVERPSDTPIKEWKTPSHDFASLDLDNLDLDEALAKLEQREIQLPETFGQADHSRKGDSAMSAHRDNTEGESEQYASLLNDDAADRDPERESAVDTSHEAKLTHEPSTRNERTEPSLSYAPGDSEHEPKPLNAVPGNSGTITHHGEAVYDESGERFSAVDDEELQPLNEPPQRPGPRLKRSRTEPGLHENVLRNKPILDLTDDPLQLDWQKPKPRWGRRFAWGLLILLAVAALAGQYVWYHFDEMARQDQYRPWFQLACPQVGCNVPSKVNIDLLKSSNLIVRSHPDFKGALVVDAIIYNRASFSQPFPLLELRFADPNGQLIASRRFKPSEYLSGEMAGKAEMPPQTPIHIALDILDPGTKAVNYSLSFRSPE
ncbi:DUF3426 domain-containing protein [Pseudomonas sp. 10B1]|uniref:DUF3426 domain-containing protein n=1 Tax=unclassified Pseudomonas TaxID=196821 RepID=UPI002AB5608E|nr:MULTISPECIES: DUF3426 domain-containing protein [unclassified Pseudomonas]MDY7563215.1 DUF3426 domain-containing protein [Pseudomonas sp. AB6]MEA9977612.1 DUF3426 domain-containing protein [Pseudomonas sp. RTS4]MEA9993703.1 DUF3426 domain-containing protein [Pseudomonas sp. AA4]MEB0085044.1 DUF3426 domain-containing protein [Pseudomonas sp. RTI1]MEB0125147.1 DUF3426 domain-containing protein [Pseudomonas sp. CCC1.2]